LNEAGFIMQRLNYLGSAGIIVLGFVLLFIGFQDYKEGMRSKNWPKVEAVITYSSAEDSHDSTSVARIEYSYEVNGMAYKGDRVYAESFDTGMSRKSAEELASKFPVGRRGPVSYDPKNPRNSILITGVGSNIWLPFYGGIIFIVFGVICFLDQRKAVKS
jgi:Protein of unknown function (DUF3592)